MRTNRASKSFFSLLGTGATTMYHRFSTTGMKKKKGN